jgi:hypothetical protein
MLMKTSALGARDPALDRIQGKTYNRPGVAFSVIERRTPNAGPRQREAKLRVVT